MLAPQQALRPDAGKACAHAADLLLHLVDLGAERGRGGLKLGHGAAQLVRIKVELTHLRVSILDPLVDDPVHSCPGRPEGRAPWTRRRYGGIDSALNVLQHTLPG